MQVILQCICNRLYQEKLPMAFNNEMKTRFKNINQYITIGSNTGSVIPDKYIATKS